MAPAASVGPSMPSVPMLAAATCGAERGQRLAPSRTRTPDCGRPCPVPRTVTVVSPEESRTPGRGIDAIALRDALRCAAAPPRALRRSPARRRRARDSRAPRRRAVRRRSRRAADRSPAPSARAAADRRSRRLRHVAGGAAHETIDDGVGIDRATAASRPARRARRRTCCRRRTVGPDAITDRSSPTTSDTASVSTVPAPRRELSALDRRQMLAHGVQLVDVRALLHQRRAVCCFAVERNRPAPAAPSAPSRRPTAARAADRVRRTRPPPRARAARRPRCRRPAADARRHTR